MPGSRDLAPTTVSDNINATHDSFVFLMPSTPAVPSQPGPIMGQGMDLSFMKCFFHYPSGAEGQSRTLKDQVICAYPPDHFAGPTNPQDHNHVFAHSTLIVRDMFAILLCWGTAQSG